MIWLVMIMREKILIVEDDIEICNLFKEFLEENGYDIKIVNIGINGMRELKNVVYNLVILDLMLLFKSGDEILRELCSFFNIFVIILFVKDMIYIKVDLLCLGVDDYVIKFFDLNEVLVRIESNLRCCSFDINIEKLNLIYKDIILN